MHCWTTFRVLLTLRDDPRTTNQMSAVFRYPDGFWPNLLALSYSLVGYTVSLVLMSSPQLVLNISGVLLCAHSMVIAAYLIHECAHNSIFRKNRYHRWLAELLLWICGAGYACYEDIRHKHVRHHTDKADVVSFDYRESIKHYPKLLKAIQILEWFYIPAMEIIMHAWVILLPFYKPEKRHRRARVMLMLALRAIYFVILASFSVTILLFYFLSYLVFLQIMRYMDTHQHTYEIFQTLDQPRGNKTKKFDRKFEHDNTYSNFISLKYPWLNLLVLNFGFHNAHHKQPGRPWHHLPSLHKQLFGDNQNQVLSFKSLITSFHRYRVGRVLNADAINMPVKTYEQDFIGVDGVSFLTTH